MADRLRGRDIVVRDGLAKGLIFNSGHSNVGYNFARRPLEPDSERAMQVLLKTGMTFYDVGANSVGFLIGARIVGPLGKVVSFEPLDTNVRVMEHNIRANNFYDNMTVLPIALGDTDGPARFLRSSQPSWGMLAGMGKEPGEFVGEINVTLKRLDTTVDEYRLPRSGGYKDRCRRGRG